MAEENIKIQAGGELKKKVENIKMISFLVCTATLSFADSSVGWKLAAYVARKASDVLTNFC